jgi:hypothetical protein
MRLFSSQSGRGLWLISIIAPKHELLRLAETIILRLFIFSRKGKRLQRLPQSLSIGVAPGFFAGDGQAMDLRSPGFGQDLPFAAGAYWESSNRPGYGDLSLNKG